MQRNENRSGMDKHLKKRSRKRLVGYSLAIFLLFIVSMFHWIGWNDRASAIYLLSGLIMLFSFRKEHVSLDFSVRNVIPCILLYICHLILNLNWTGNLLNTAIYTNALSFLFPVMMMVCISPSDKKTVLDNVSRWFAWLMIPALFLYVLSLFVTLPSFGTVSLSDSFESAGSDYGVARNCIFLLQPINSGSFTRFRGPFLEPGHLGMMCAFLLFANRHDYRKKHNLILLISLAATFSLAGYVLWAIGFFMIRYAQNRIRLSNLLLYSFILLSLFAFSQLYKNGDNLINELIFSRLTYDQDKGISGNNRSGAKTTLMFAEMLGDKHVLLHGYDENELTFLKGEAGNGLKYYLVVHGLIGLLLAFVYYLSLLFISKNKKIAVLSFLFVFLMFIQRTYPFWFSWIMCYNYMIDIPFAARPKIRGRIKKRKIPTCAR